MRKFQRITNEKPKEPTKEQLVRYKDFASLSHKYERLAKRPKKPLYRDPKLFLLLLILGLMFLLVFLES
jgi:zona occludens toxin (predicted ATPase)